MPNNWFQFKQFRIAQDRCAMKVSTDACIQGAWASQQLSAGFRSGTLKCGLDIGTGTGLLSLMLAQELHQLWIDAIELHADAAAQAAENFAGSPWNDRLHAVPVSLADFAAVPVAQNRYDLIICNPPFFHNQLQAPSVARNDARHSTALSKESLALALQQLLQEDGCCCIMYPATEWADWLQAAALQGLYPARILEVQPKGAVAVNRIIGLFRKEESVSLPAERLTIYHEDHSYTDPFIRLMQPYYLKL